jgi:hypothetical protein
MISRIPFFTSHIYLTILIGLFAIIFLYASVSLFYRAFLGPHTDFNIYYQTAERIIQGQGDTLYQPFDRGESWRYVYLPAFACVFVPFSMLPLPIAIILWCILNGMMIGHIAVLLIRTLSIPKEKLGFFGSILFLTTGMYLLENVQLGQVHVLLAYLIVLAWSHSRKGADLAAGIFLGGAIVIKLFPVVLLFYFILQRKWKGLLSAILTLGILVFLFPIPFLGWNVTWNHTQHYTSEVILPFLSAETQFGYTYELITNVDSLHNQDLGSLLQRHFSSLNSLPESYKFLNWASVPAKQVRLWMFGISFLFILITLVWLSRIHTRWECKTLRVDRIYSVLLVLAFLIIPRLRLAYLLPLALPTLVLLMDFTLGDSKDLRRVGLILVFIPAFFWACTAVEILRACSVGFYGMLGFWMGILFLYTRVSKSDDPIRSS